MKYAQQTSPLSQLDVGYDAIMFNRRQRTTRESKRRKKLERTTLEHKV
jgi:hypothetical protein